VRARTSRKPVVAGVSVSLSGPLHRQGRDAYDGLRLWVDHVACAGGLTLGRDRSNRPLRLITLDDESSSTRARENVARLLTEERVDLLLGPYGSGSTLAVAPLAAAHGKILWNHGGASDAITKAGSADVVSVLSPASNYLRDLPRLVRHRTGARRATVLYAKRGTFATSVGRGVEAGARAAGFDVVRAIAFDTPLRDTKTLLGASLADSPNLLVVAGRFEDDVAITRERGLLEAVEAVACVAAGTDAFHQELGMLAEGVMGPSQWESQVYERPSIGPTSAWFCSAFRRVFQRDPSYVAAQAYALGIIIGECIRRADSLEDRELLAAVRRLDTTTLYGRFRLDPGSSRQVGHEILLVEWRAGRMRPLAPTGVTSNQSAVGRPRNTERDERSRRCLPPSGEPRGAGRTERF
jgi:branched-chain amino acid transport system substrate-binding protein